MPSPTTIEQILTTDQLTRLARLLVPFKFAPPQAHPAVNVPTSGSKFQPGNLTVTVSTNLPGVGHRLELTKLDGAAVASLPSVPFGGSTTATVTLPVPDPGPDGAIYFLTITPDDGGPPHAVVIEVPPLVAPIVTTPDPPTITAGQSVSFNTTPAGGTGDYYLTWRITGMPTVSDVTPISHRFEDPGTYQMRLTVSDSNPIDPRSNVVTRLVTVNPAPVPFAVPVFRRAPADAAVPLNTEVRFFARFEGGATPYQYVLDPDGSAGQPQGTTSSTFEVPVGSFIFRTAGDYTSTLSATDGNGATANQSLPITVDP